MLDLRPMSVCLRLVATLGMAGCAGEPTCEEGIHSCQELVTGECDWANDRQYRACLSCREDNDTCQCVLLDETGREAARAEDSDCQMTILEYCEYES